ncbi:patatin-like phospholipase family protein [Pseudonocardia xinjiangensis]|uniref:Patatin-like phospholipase family protein n=1 Tax=Pseudonocardia xinjiangensis TaxID=75289 RepID=A0ABX1RP05_9PSEU|nr:patatin-like phospholipase family protein [Pseudonocardia xinjiangensis]NMH80825.1 patatin-like phospholipase family protein [Pseudonocardia xinjiangensis]
MPDRRSTRDASRRAPRVGLVLGAGGILGSAWMVGALSALAARLDRPLGEVDLVLGTSAGSVLAAALRCGMDVPELLAHQRGADPADPADRRPEDLPEMRAIDRESGEGFPPLPLPLLGSPRLLVAAATPPWRMNPVIAASGLLPRGRGRMGSLVRMVDVLQARIGITADGWVPGAPLWVVAVDYDSGRRVVFGRPGAPPSSVADAVLASCSIPGWFAPRTIDGRRYVDGGVASSTSLALLARPGAPELDEVYVLAPLASHDYDRSLDPIVGVERGVRRLITRWLDAEVEAVRATGARVTVLLPGAADLLAMGGNLMNPRRREQVLDTALTTASETLAEALGSGRSAA